MKVIIGCVTLLSLVTFTMCPEAVTGLKDTRYIGGSPDGNMYSIEVRGTKATPNLMPNLVPDVTYPLSGTIAWKNITQDSDRLIDYTTNDGLEYNLTYNSQNFRLYNIPDTAVICVTDDGGFSGTDKTIVFGLLSVPKTFGQMLDEIASRPGGDFISVGFTPFKADYGFSIAAGKVVGDNVYAEVISSHKHFLGYLEYLPSIGDSSRSALEPNFVKDTTYNFIQWDSGLTKLKIYATEGGMYVLITEYILAPLDTKIDFIFPRTATKGLVTVLEGTYHTFEYSSTLGVITANEYKVTLDATGTNQVATDVLKYNPATKTYDPDSAGLISPLADLTSPVDFKSEAYLGRAAKNINATNLNGLYYYTLSGVHTVAGVVSSASRPYFFYAAANDSHTYKAIGVGIKTN